MQYASTSRWTLTLGHKDFLRAFRPIVPILKIWGNRHWLMWESYFLLKMTRWMNIYIPIQSWKLLGFGWFTCVGTWWARMQHASTSRWTLTSDYQNLTNLSAHGSYSFSFLLYNDTQIKIWIDRTWLDSNFFFSTWKTTWRFSLDSFWKDKSYLLGILS